MNLVIHMKKIIIPILLAAIIGFGLGYFMVRQYDGLRTIIPVNAESKPLYFVQQGVYSTLENVQNNTTDFPNYIYQLEDGKYYVYIAITKSEENAKKIKEYYAEKGYVTYIKQIKIKNQEFINNLEQYDALLSQTTDTSTIPTICTQILTKYKELVQNDNQN